jgi:hypothetical protein
VLVVPDTFPQREPILVERAALEQKEDFVTAFGRVPTRGSSSGLDFFQLGIVGSAVWYENLQRVECWYSARMILEPPQF